MNSHPDHTSPMLGRTQFYDDSKLQKRTNFLVSGLILCFVIAIAALGVSIMVMMQGKEQIARLEIEKPSAAKSQSEIARQLDDARLKIATLQQQVHELQREDSKSSEVFDAFDELPLPEVPLREEKKVVKEEEEINHHHHNHHMPEPDAQPEEPNAEDTIDMYFTEDGSGEFPEDDEDDYELEGSGSSDCPPFPTPVCPGSYSICTRGEEDCPISFCCLKETNDNHHNHHHH